jgi:hypothetical protein
MSSQSTSSSNLVASTAKREITQIVALLLVGVVLPLIVHLIPSPIALGPVLMPLMIPIALAAFILPMRSAFTVAVVMPFLSMVTSGMPPLPIAFELAAEGIILVVAVQLMLRFKTSWWLALVGGIILSRLAGLGYIVLLLHQDLGVASISIASGLVGLSIAGMVLPVLFKLFGRPR